MRMREAPSSFDKKSVAAQASRLWRGLALSENNSAYHDGRSLIRSEEHTSELQSLMRISYAVFCLKKKNMKNKQLKSKLMSHLTKQKNTQIYSYTNEPSTRRNLRI